MKFVCEGMILSDAAFTVVKACATKTITPVLECIKLQAKNDVLTLTAYDGEISIEKKVKAEVMDEGEVCVNGKFFSDFVGKISFSDVVISSDEKGIAIRYGESESYMQTLPASDFPIISCDIEEDKYFETSEKNFKELISKVVFCCATDESRPILKGCLLEVKENTLYASALDGFRMACSHTELLSKGGDMKIVCPARTLNEISRMLGDDETVKIYADKNRLSVSTKETTITSRLYTGEFVKKENIFPVQFTTNVKISKDSLLESVERASILIRGDKNNLVVFDIKNGKVTVSANSEIGKIEESIEAEIEGVDLRIAVNGKYMTDALKALKEEKIILSFNSAIAPFTLENEEDKKDEYLVMPLRTSTSA